MNNQKSTRLENIWVCLLYLVCAFGGYTPALIMVGLSLYFKMVSRTETIEKGILRAILVPTVFYIGQETLKLLPDTLAIIANIIQIFDMQNAYIIVTNIINTLLTLLNVVQVLIMLAMLVTTITDMGFQIPFVDTIVDKIYQTVKSITDTASDKDENFHEAEADGEFYGIEDKAATQNNNEQHENHEREDEPDDLDFLLEHGRVRKRNNG